MMEATPFQPLGREAQIAVALLKAQCNESQLADMTYMLGKRYFTDMDLAVQGMRADFPLAFTDLQPKPEVAEEALRHQIGLAMRRLRYQAGNAR